MNETTPGTGAAGRLRETASLKDSAGKEVVSAVLVVDATMKAWAAYVVANKVPDEAQAAAKLAYEEYQVAVRAAQEASAAMTGTADKSAWNEARAALVAKSSALIDLITQGSAQAGLKNLLVHFAMPKLTALATYFSIQAIRAEVQAARRSLKPATLNHYLHELTAAHLIHDAGRGWYSSVATPFNLNRKPVSSLIQNLSKTFPLLDFSVWSTEQIASYGHLLLTKFVSFVHTDRDSMQSVLEFLRDKGFDAYLNPRGPAASQFTVRERTVVVRPRVTTQPAEDHFVTIEGLLVELFVESQALGLLDSGEYLQVFSNATRAGRISMGSLTEYAGKRKTAAKDLLQSIKREFSKNSRLIDSPID